MSVRKLVTDLRKGLAFSPIIVAPSELKIRLDKEDPFFSDELSREEVKETYFNLTLLH